MLETLLKSDRVKFLHHVLQEEESVLFEELWNAPKAAIGALAQKASGKHLVILTGGSQEEVALYHDFALFSNRPLVEFPAWETLPDENVPPSPDIVGERYKVLESILHSDEPHIIITSLQALLQKLIDPRQFCDLHLSLKVGESTEFEWVLLQLEEMGYVHAAVAADKGEYAVRGGIIDVFPVSSPDPYRIEFFGDEVESIRIYDPVGQKTVRPVNYCMLTPARELELLSKEKELVTLLDYLGNNALIMLDDLAAIEDRYVTLSKMLETKSSLFSSFDEFLEMIAPCQKLFITSLPLEKLSRVKPIEKIENPFSSSHSFQKIEFEAFGKTFQAVRPFALFVSISDYLFADEELSGDEMLSSLSERKDGEVHLICASDLEENSLKEKVNLPASWHRGYLSKGLALADVGIALLPYTEISHRYKIRRQKLRSTYHTVPSQAYELHPGDHVVHFQHGIGKYLGLEKRPDHNGIEKEYFLVEYAKHSKLFIPLNQAHLLTKYIGANEEVPTLHTMGSTRWQRTRDKTQQALMGYASELLELYAKREMHGGFSFGPDSSELQSFEEDFPFEETEDQIDAISCVKSDMQEKKPMDRLVCGDVGYGKTEVAMRSAVKAVIDGGKQVAVLVPTTVLAMQHYENFVERMANFPIRVGVLSRFVKPKQVRETLEGIEKGVIDILIGTHRIISGDVNFKNLGLIVIDEEQRFGVKAKEHLKKVKTGVDCLTLSATPIPRTLYMSLVGARDMSVINTPPQDRLPIKTILCEPNEKVIKNALMRELARDGQAYIIHNRVETIFDYASRIQKILPQARIVVGHGQMAPKDIDEVFHTFKSGQANILVATSIVENGIDIPNANTIIIDRADRFGLADLYQLRGRVGRWNRRAYCYFLVPKLHALPEISRQRLNALAESSGYGGGMKVAMRDLEIRGAGDMLGYEQSGSVASIGFQLYCKMLKRTILTLQGKLSPNLTETKVECHLDARLPAYYVNEVSLRMEFYQRLGEATSLEEVESIWEELCDRFGKPPEEAKALYHLSRIRVVAGQNSLSQVKIESTSITIEKVGMIRKKELAPFTSLEAWEETVLESLKDI